MLKTELLKRKRELETHFENIEKWMQTAPVGKIWISSRKRGKEVIYRYFIDKKELFPQKDRIRIKNLMSKDYYVALLSAIKEDITQIENLLKTENQIINTYKNLHKAKKQFVKPLQEPVEDMIHRFLKEDFSPSDYRIKNPKPTLKGEKVRSFTEAKIADALFLAEIPYRYEKPFMLFNEHEVRPDFTIMHPMTGEIFLWEHLGLAEKQSYKSTSVSKIKDYAKSGMLPGKNLILTFEDDEFKTTDLEIQKLIEAFFC